MSKSITEQLEVILEEICKLDIGPDDPVPELFQDLFTITKRSDEEIEKAMKDLDKFLDNIPTKKD